MWDALFNFPEALQKGADVTTYVILAAIGTILFLARLVIALFFGTDGGDLGADADAGADAGTDASFTLFSLLSIMAFIMGTGWMGLAARVDWDLGRAPSAVLAVGFGVLMMFVASGLMYFTRRLNRDIHYDLRTAIGKTARVYLTLPAKGRGEGQVEVSVSGRKKVLRAVNKSEEELQAFTDVRVVDVRDDETLVVEKL